MFLAIVAVVGLAYCLWSSSEPVYRGKTITACIDAEAAGPQPDIQQYYGAIEAIGTNALPYVVRNLARNDSSWHSNYVALYPKLPKALKKFLPKPKPLLHAVEGVNAFVYAGSNAIPVAIPLLKHRSKTVREVAAGGLGALRRKYPAAKQAIPALTEVLSDSARMVRFDAALTLAEMGPDASNAVPALTKLLADSGRSGDPEIASIPYVQAVAANALGSIGPPAAAALPELGNALQATNPYLRGQAAVAIWRISGDVDTTLPVLLREMPGEIQDSKWDWIIALGEMGPRAKTAIPQLKMELKQDTEPWVLKYVTNALMKIDSNAIPKIEDEVKAQDAKSK
jgi:hypothetical protein